MTTAPSPLPVADLVAAARPFGHSRMLPAAAYTSPEVFAWEQRRWFAGAWTWVGRVEELFTDGAVQRGLRVGDIPVLLTHDGDRVSGFADTCRHRGHELLGDRGCSGRQAVVCPYHGWAYRLDGSLVAAPGLRDVPGFDPSDHGLIELPVETWHGWLAVNATADAGPLAAQLGDVGPLVAPYRPSSLAPAATHGYDVAANWKVLTENYHECYHCPHIHPELSAVSPPASGTNYDSHGAWVGGSMQLRDGGETMSLSGASDGDRLPDAPPGEVRYLGLLPNLLLSLHPDYVMTHRLSPLAPDRTHVECRWYFAPDTVERPGFDPSYAVAFWDLTNRQDWAACESVQRGLASPHYRPGPLAPNEDAVYRVESALARAYLGTPLHHA